MRNLCPRSRNRSISGSKFRAANFFSQTQRSPESTILTWGRRHLFGRYFSPVFFPPAPGSFSSFATAAAGSNLYPPPSGQGALSPHISSSPPFFVGPAFAQVLSFVRGRKEGGKVRIWGRSSKRREEIKIKGLFILSNARTEKWDG